ncbi:MAG: BON domain-containing protein [Hydrogenophaga sp.]
MKHHSERVFCAVRPVAMALSVATLVTTLSACAPLVIGGAVGSAIVVTDRRTSGAQLEDQGIELRAASRLRDQLGDRGNVSVTSYNRVVLVTGEVPTEADKTRVERTVAGVDNVRSVVNEVAVLGAASLSQRSSDTLVTGRVKAALVDAQDLSASVFKVVTARGTVYLMGRVTQREADRATEVTRNTTGVQRVVRVLEIITEQELAAMQPKPAPAPVKDAGPSR